MPFNKGFIVETGETSFHIFYEKEYKKEEYGWALNSKPDFSVEVNGELKIIMDAKNWLAQHNEAKYKMLGYLNNLDATTGILFFPLKKALNGYLETDKPLKQLKNHKNQSLLQFVIPFQLSNKLINKKNEALEKLSDIILKMAFDYDVKCI
jgi:hypothetical protein